MSLLEIAQKARDTIASQSTIWKAGSKNGNDQFPAFDPVENKICQCVGLAISDASPTDEATHRVCAVFLEVNNVELPASGDFKLAVFNWNDRPETTHEGAVAALDKLVDYLRTPEGD